MVEGVNDSRRNDWHGCFTDSGWWFGRLDQVYVDRRDRAHPHDRVAVEILGDDEDGIAATLEDFGL